MNAEEKQKLIKDLKISIGESDNRRAFVLVQRGILMDALEMIERQDSAIKEALERIKNANGITDEILIGANSTEIDAMRGGVITSGKQVIIGSDYSSEQIVSECAGSEREV